MGSSSVEKWSSFQASQLLRRSRYEASIFPGGSVFGFRVGAPLVEAELKG
jgi:hypothetical protein